MIQLLRDLRKKLVIGFVGGSDLVKIREQLEVAGSDGTLYIQHRVAVYRIECSTISQLFKNSTMLSQRTV